MTFFGGASAPLSRREVAILTPRRGLSVGFAEPWAANRGPAAWNPRGVSPASEERLIQPVTSLKSSQGWSGLRSSQGTLHSHISALSRAHLPGWPTIQSSSARLLSPLRLNLRDQSPQQAVQIAFNGLSWGTVFMPDLQPLGPCLDLLPHPSTVLLFRRVTHVATQEPDVP